LASQAGIIDYGAIAATPLACRYAYSSLSQAPEPSRVALGGGAQTTARTTAGPTQ